MISRGLLDATGETRSRYVLGLEARPEEKPIDSSPNFLKTIQRMLSQLSRGASLSRSVTPLLFTRFTVWLPVPRADLVAGFACYDNQQY